MSARKTASRRTDPVDWALHAGEEEILEALGAGGHERSLREYFGAAALEELTALAAAARKAKRRGPRVLLLPGMMQSRLCEASRTGRARQVLWIDPNRIAAGALLRLALGGAAPIEAHGVLLFSYAKLELSLAGAGFRTGFFAYDWRLGIEETGAALAARIAAGAEPVSLVAHSMGGLIARAAMHRLPKRLVRRLIMLGTPNRGSFVPLQALRGTHPFVQKVAQFDHGNSAEQLASRVFATFPGLYHLLPPRRGARDLDLLNPASWPAEGPQPDPALLAQAAAVRRRLAAADSRMAHIVGTHRDTVVAVRRAAGGFEYASDSNGDGTVPAALAVLPKLKSYFIDEAHGNLPNNPTVIRAILDLLKSGTTRRLPERFVARRTPRRRIDDATLSRAAGGAKIHWRRLSSAQREAAFADLDGSRPPA